MAGKQTVHLWSLCEDVVMETGPAGGLTLTGPLGTERVDRPDPLVREALRRMELGPVLLGNVPACRTSPDDEPDADAVLLPVLSRLSHLVVRTLGMDDLKGPLLSVAPLARHADFTPVRPSGRGRWRMPGEVSLTQDGAGAVLASPGSPYRVVLHRPEAMWVAGMLAWPVTPYAIAQALPLAVEVVQAVLGYLAGAGMAVRLGHAEE